MFEAACNFKANMYELFHELQKITHKCIYFTMYSYFEKQIQVKNRNI